MRELAWRSIALVMLFSSIAYTFALLSRPYIERAHVVRGVAAGAIQGLSVALLVGRFTDAAPIWALVGAVFFGGALLDLRLLNRPEDHDRRPEYSSALGNRLALAGGVLIVGILVLGAVAMDGAAAWIAGGAALLLAAWIRFRMLKSPR